MRNPYVFSLLALAVLLLSAVAQDSKELMPTDEHGLFQYASRHMNRRQWRVADRAFRKLLEKYPESKLAENTYFNIGKMHVRFSRQRDAAREWLEKFCERFPESGRYWQARFLVAESYSLDKVKDKAIAELRRIIRRSPNAYDKTNAAQRILGLQDKYFRLYVNRSFTEGENAQIQLSTRNIDTVAFTAYQIGFDELIERLDPKQPSLPLAASKVARKQWKRIRSWTRKLDARKGRYHNSKVQIPVKGVGFYVVEAVHAGVTMTVSFPVNRYGMTVKSAAGKTVIFLQDRVTGVPVPGMSVRILEEGRTREFKTESNGLLVLGDTKPNAALVARKDGDYVFANVRTYGWTGKQSRYYITTDRPIYRPNQKVSFKVVHRTADGAELKVQPDLKAMVRIFDARSNEIYKAEHVVNEFGSFSGSFQLGDEPALGNYRIQVDPLVTSAPVHDWNARYGRFRVDEYRKPEYKVGVTYARPHYVQGEVLEATIAADYYFGSPVPHAHVTYSVMRRSYWYRPHRRSAWWAWYAEDHWGGMRSYGKRVANGTGKTDENGRLKITVPLPRWDHDATYTVVANVTDLSRRMVKGSGSVRVNRAAFSLAVQTDRYLYRPGDTIKATIKAATPEGKPVIGQKLKIVASQRYWRSSRYHDEPVIETTGFTDQNGQIEVPLRVTKPGYYNISVSGKDARGNETQSTRWAWVASEGWNAGHIHWQGVDVVPDKPSYKPGETATFLISSEKKDDTVLFTLESTRIHHQQVVKLNGNTKTITFRLDDRSMVPNFYATVTTMRSGRLYQRQRAIMLDPARRFLNVEIRPNRARYRPRDPASFEIITRDHSGAPVPAEVELMIVDESIYALQAEFAQDIRKFFLPKRWNRVQTSSSLQYWQAGVGGLDEDSKEDSGGGLAGAPAKKAARGVVAGFDYAETEVRSKFADTMFYRAHVVTDEYGRATVRLEQVADNLTTWRVTARAMSRDGRMGQGKTSMLVRKDVIVRLHTPRFFTQGDKTTLSAVVHNYLDSKKQVKVILSATGLAVGGEMERIVEIEAQGEKRLDWPVTIASPGMATIIVKALTDEESDAMEIKVPLLPHGSLAWSSSTHLVRGALETSVDIPEDAIPETTELHVIVSPTHAATVLDALDYLADYPYGCVEQTMSRFLPSAITLQVLRKLNIRKPGLEAELPAMINQGLQRLYSFQNPDGGWGWWRSDSSNPFTTAYVVYGLALAQDADVAVADRVMRRGVNALRKLLNRAEDDEQRVYLLYALSAAGHTLSAIRNALADDLKKLAPVYKAMLALTLYRDGERAEARRVLESLAADAQTRGATVHFRGLKHYRWTGHNIETTALALKAFLAIDPENELVSRIVTWLAMGREGNHWVSTRQTAMVVYAMADYLARTGELDPDLTLTLTVNGKQLYEKRVTRENWREFDGNLQVDRALLKPGKNTIRLVSRGKGSPVCSIYLKHFKKAGAFTASKGALRVERRYELVVHSGGKRLLVPLGDTSQVKSGDEVQVTLKVTADREYSYLMLEDPIPAGFEAVREQPHRYHRRWTWWYSHKEFRDEKVAVAISRLPEGEREVSYVMRAETPGEFKVLPTLVWNMYRRGEGANSKGRMIKVVDN